jgi:hypothetical protein
MLLNEIKHTADHATGVDPKTKFPVIITKSISYIYKTYQKETGTGTEIHYDPVTWKNKIELGQMESLLLGYALTQVDLLDLQDLVIRFGWISKDMYQLEWVPIGLLFDKYLNNELTPTEKNKFQQICRTLCIPMRELTKRRKVYQESKKEKSVKEVTEAEFA